MATIKQTLEENVTRMHRAQVEETLNAAIAYAAACARCGASFTRLDIVQFCVNSFPSITAKDALDIAHAVRGAYVG